jgi:nicotinamide mononucleotide (NMN) deamidase PncC
VGRLLLEAGLTIACAESLTGGGLGARISSVPGASAYFLGSAVTYGEEAKRAVLGVAASTLDRHGPVSRECAAEMASGARRVFGADLAVRSRGRRAPRRTGARDGLESLETRRRHQRILRWPGTRSPCAASPGRRLDLVRRQLRGLPLPA